MIQTNLKKMTTEEALKVLEVATQNLNVGRMAHLQILQALQVLDEAVKMRPGRTETKATKAKPVPVPEKGAC